MCGRAGGYQKGDTLGFHGYRDATIDQSYVSGLSITYGNSPCKHIWTFTSGCGEKSGSPLSCPCSLNGGRNPPLYVGKNYFCESVPWYGSGGPPYFFNDTFWDGAHCTDSCCYDPTLPWFYHELSQTTQDDIEA